MKSLNFKSLSVEDKQFVFDILVSDEVTNPCTAGRLELNINLSTDEEIINYMRDNILESHVSNLISKWLKFCFAEKYYVEDSNFNPSKYVKAFLYTQTSIAVSMITLWKQGRFMESKVFYNNIKDKIVSNDSVNIVISAIQIANMLDEFPLTYDKNTLLAIESSRNGLNKIKEVSKLLDRSIKSEECRLKCNIICNETFLDILYKLNSNEGRFADTVMLFIHSIFNGVRPEELLGYYLTDIGNYLLKLYYKDEKLFTSLVKEEYVSNEIKFMILGYDKYDISLYGDNILDILNNKEYNLFALFLSYITVPLAVAIQDKELSDECITDSKNLLNRISMNTVNLIVILATNMFSKLYNEGCIDTKFYTMYYNTVTRKCNEVTIDADEGFNPVIYNIVENIRNANLGDDIALTIKNELLSKDIYFFNLEKILKSAKELSEVLLSKIWGSNTIKAEEINTSMIYTGLISDIINDITISALSSFNTKGNDRNIDYKNTEILNKDIDSIESKVINMNNKINAMVNTVSNIRSINNICNSIKSDIKHIVADTYDSL